MYNYALYQSGPGLYYNTTPGSGDLSSNNSPWGFFRTPLPGAPEGYPLVFTAGLEEARVPVVLKVGYLPVLI